jgi:hypothetical protein
LGARGAADGSHPKAWWMPSVAVGAWRVLAVLLTVAGGPAHRLGLGSALPSAEGLGEDPMEPAVAELAEVVAEGLQGPLSLDVLEAS